MLTVFETSSTLWILLVVLVFMAEHVDCEIRCYCNLPSCVSTGYMCKSAQNACFTEHFAFTNDLTQSRHGCLELLHGHKKLLCRQLTQPKNGQQSNSAESPKHESSGSQIETAHFPTVFCCQEDMCNYIGSMDIRVHVQAKSNHTQGSSFDDKGYPFGVQDVGMFANQDLWFKAAVIAVPIAGSFILVLLILLAYHMLKQDTKRQRHVVELRRQRQFKARLYLEETFAEKPHSYLHYNHPNGRGHHSHLTSDNKDYVYERPVSVSLWGSHLPLATKWDNSNPPAFV